MNDKVKCPRCEEPFVSESEKTQGICPSCTFGFGRIENTTSKSLASLDNTKLSLVITFMMRPLNGGAL